MSSSDKWSWLMQDPKFSRQRYQDEPILRTAASLKIEMPEPYQQMRRLALQNGTRTRTPEEIFYRQAAFMADFEDTYVYDGEFFRYFPTFQSMSNAQLRGYFSWRTCVRHGDLHRTSLSFAFVYLYELLNGIGAADAQDGFERLRAFCEAYIPIDRGIERYANLWLRDYILYHGLDVALLEPYMHLQTEQAYSVLRDYDTATDDALFGALCDSSSYNLRHSRFYRDYSDEMQTVVCAAYRAYADYYASNRKFNLFASVIGRPYTTGYVPFSSAVFYAPQPHPDVQIELSPFTSFRCRNDRWSYTRLWSSTDGARQIGTLLKYVDAVMRQQRQYPHPLKSVNVPKYLQKIVADTLEDCREQAAKKAARAVTIDFSKLQGIRDAADVTRDKLIVEEEPDDAPMPAPEEPAPTADERPFGLDETEYNVLCALLNGGDADAPARQKGLPLSVVADSINEKCFDTFADTVLLCDDGGVTVLEDYIQELRGMLL